MAPGIFDSIGSQENHENPIPTAFMRKDEDEESESEFKAYSPEFLSIKGGLGCDR